MIYLLLLPWFGVVFFTLGLFVNILQLCILPLFWLNRNIYQVLTNKLAYNLYSVFTFLGDWWGGIDLHMYGKEEDIRKLSDEKSLVIVNHNGDVDWLICWVFAERLNCLERTNAFIKDIVKYIPTFGWCWWFAGWGFLKRNWKDDQKNMFKQIDACKMNETNYSITLFCEGTRRTEAKLKASQEYALKNGKEPLKHHLLPRTKGFAVVAHHLREHVGAVYDGEVAFPFPEKATIANLLNGQRIEVHLHLRRTAMKDVPSSTEQEAAQFCSNVFKEKDNLMEHFIQHGKFPGKKVHLPKNSFNLMTFIFHNIWIGALFSSVVRSFTLWYGGTLVFTSLFALFATVLVLLRTLTRVTETKKGSSFGLNNNIEKKKTT